VQFIVITGARGYIGSALSVALAKEGHALRLVSRSAFDAQSTPTVQHVQADLRDSASWLELMDDAKAIVHLSSRTDLRAAEADPAGDRDLNVTPVRMLVQAAERRSVAIPAVFASTVTIFGVDPKLPADEMTPERCCSVYDRHKLECETILGEATARGVLHACSLRLANVYGYSDGMSSINSNRGVLNAMMRRAVDGQPLTLFGDGAYVRDFIHLQDVVDAFVRAITVPDVQDGRPHVIATGKGQTLAQAYGLIADAAEEFGRDVEIRRVAEPPDLHPSERRNFIGNSRLFRERTGWQSRFDLKAGIADYFRRTLAAAELGGRHGEDHARV
jgi:nucleoside-diphosphate-sugar epimerase